MLLKKKRDRIKEKLKCIQIKLWFMMCKSIIKANFNSQYRKSREKTTAWYSSEPRKHTIELISIAKL